MKRFTITVTAFPVTEIDGVQWADGTAAIRVKAGQTWESPYVGRVADLEEAYGGYPDFKLKWLDK
ncbi:hypothetical protein ABZ470_23630 [Streptosporangium sp. NPDC020072]|uniref:hypothetical protein n=1 Tax=Streptosporangium sp. NPDC020072 TaxID=3154788 RepID=UPI003415387F